MRPKPEWTPGRKIAELARMGRNLRYWIGVPAANPVRWSEVYRIDADGISTMSGEHYRPGEVLAWMAASPENVIFEAEGDLKPLPGMSALEHQALPVPDRVTDAELKLGRALVKVTHGPCGLPWRSEKHFSTTLENIGATGVRVVSFAAYAAQLRPGAWSTPTHFLPAQFRAWYDVGLEEWIEPGGRVCDPGNWSDRGLLWGYRLETREGERFVSGAVIR